MLTFHCDHEEFALRPEMTAPVCRLMSSGALDALPLPHKLYYVGPCFRYCRPHSGRYREFTQAGLECIGATGPAADAEIIALACRILRQVGVSQFALKIGNTGVFRDLLPQDLDPEDRAVVIGHLDQLVSINEKCRLLAGGQDSSVIDDLRFERMELAALQADADYAGSYAISERPQIDVSEYAELLPKEAAATFRRIWKAEEMVSEASAELLLKTSGLRGSLEEVHHAAQDLLSGTPAMAALEELLSVCSYVRTYGVPEFEVVLGIARGFTFYTSTVFEISSAPGNGGAKYCGGGRYDGLVELFGGPPLPATGCAFRFDALVDAFLHENDWQAPAPYQLFLLADSEQTLPRAIALAEDLRFRGLRIGLDVAPGGRLTAAEVRNRRAEYLAVLSEASVERNRLRITAGGEPEEVPLDADAIVSKLSNPRK